MIELFSGDAQAANEQGMLREYIGFIWIGDEPGVRLRVWAKSLDEADDLVNARFGAGHVVSIWNEEDAQKPR